MMKLEITVYKQTGKYYTSTTVTHDQDIRTFDDEFLPFIAENLPGRCGDGFVVVTDKWENQSFHNCLLRESDLKKFL